MSRRILVTGGNAGIGFALCSQLAEKGCHVYLCSRNIDKGMAAVQQIMDQQPAAKVELVPCDTSCDKSVAGAAGLVKESLGGDALYAIVNNAGCGLNQAGDVSVDNVCNTNMYGPKRVCEAFIPLLQPSGARIVNVGSGAGPGFVNKNPQHRDLLCRWSTTWEQLEALAQTKPWDADAPVSYYGFSKAGLHVFSRVLSQTHPAITTSTVSPGFILTAMTKGWGAKKPPEEGTVSILHCLFDELTGSGFFYGSDAKRSPLHYMRDPGTPEYLGDEDYDQGR